MKNSTREKLFGNGKPAKLPGLEAVENEAATPADDAPEEVGTNDTDDAKQTIWFETREIQGGRNILDLSKRSLIEHGDPAGTPFDLGETNSMRGGVEFFGLSPTDIDNVATITIISREKTISITQSLS